MKKPIIFICLLIIIYANTPVSFCQEAQNEIIAGLVLDHLAVSPTSILEGIRPFSNYLTKKLGVKVKVEIESNTDKLLEKLKDGTYSIGYVSNLDYVELKNKREIVPFAKTVKGGGSNYNAVILVRKDSTFGCIDDLKGKKFAYTSKNSSHGYLFPCLLIKNRFKTPLESFFAPDGIIKTKKDPDGILAVLYKKADAVSASSINFSILSDLIPRIKRDLKVIETSPPLVYGPMFYDKENFTDKKLRDKCIYEILNMDKTVEGKQILLLFKVGGWTNVLDSDYNGLRELLKQNI